MTFKKITWNHPKGYGTPYDRGSADSHYHRPFNPHYNVWKEGKCTTVLRVDMTNFEVNEYYEGYRANEKCGSKKEY